MGRRRLAFVFVYNATPIDCWGALATGRVLRIPVVLDLSDEWHDPSAPLRSLGLPRYLFKRFAEATEKVVYRGVRRIVVVSRHLERRLAHNAKESRKLACRLTQRMIRLSRATRYRVGSDGRREICGAGARAG